uniref:Uncharacterized protein n=1 Tax=Plectus sambesii TaxID=2011161 RepID=A0A914VXC9_9BILA
MFGAKRSPHACRAYRGSIGKSAAPTNRRAQLTVDGVGCGETRPLQVVVCICAGTKKEARSAVRAAPADASTNATVPAANGR